MQLSDEQKNVINNFKDFYPFLMLAVERARTQYPGSVIKLGILAVQPEGSGQIVASFKADDFLNDLRKLIEFDKELAENIEISKKARKDG